MTAKEFLRNEEYTEGGEGYILTIQEMADLMERYALMREKAKLLSRCFVNIVPNDGCMCSVLTRIHYHSKHKSQLAKLTYTTR
jgi:hypothetical protein